MDTHFSAEQLADPALAQAAEVIETCIHCGFCNPTCPTYLVSQDEADGPRGRIGIMQSLLETGRAPTGIELDRLDRCLTCMSCHSTCSPGVNYRHLLSITRARIEAKNQRPLGPALLRRVLAQILPNRRAFDRAVWAARMARPLRRLLPGPLARLIDMARPVAPETPPIAPGLYHAEGAVRSRVLLATGCVQSRLDPEIDHATLRLLTRLGVEVLVPAAQGCCGALAEHLGQGDRAASQARALLAVWSAATADFIPDAVIITASGCGFHIKDWPFHLPDDPTAARFAALTQDLAKFLVQLGLGPVTPPVEIKEWPVALHIPCSQVHGMGIYLEPKTVLEAAGFAAQYPEDLHLCCGAAGTYGVFQPEMAAALKTQKLDKLMATAPKVIASGNMGCNAHLRDDAPVPVVHIAQLLDWATGGPKPRAIKD